MDTSKFFLLDKMKVINMLIKTLLILIFCSFIISSSIPHHDFTPYLINVRKTKNLEQFLRRLPYTFVSQTPEYITIEVPYEEEITVLEEHGYHVDHIYKNTPQYKQYIEYWGKLNGSYHNYEELTRFMKDMKAAYADIFDFFSIGKSVTGRELWVCFFFQKQTF